MKTVKVGRMPGKINEYVLNDGATVADALALAEITAGANDEVRVGTDKVTNLDGHTLSNGDIVIVAEMVKGN